MEINISYEYLHAERLSSEHKGQASMQVQLTFPSSPPRRKNNSLEARFLTNITSQPPLIVITLKGVLKARGEKAEIDELERGLSQGKPDPELVHILTSNVLFEAMMLMRELGFPPTLPLPSPQGPNGEPGFKPV